jgi:hypothetical protein
MRTDRSTLLWIAAAAAVVVLALAVSRLGRARRAAPPAPQAQTFMPGSPLFPEPPREVPSTTQPPVVEARAEKPAAPAPPPEETGAPGPAPEEGREIRVGYGTELRPERFPFRVVPHDAPLAAFPVLLVDQRLLRPEPYLDVWLDASLAPSEPGIGDRCRADRFGPVVPTTVPPTLPPPPVSPGGGDTFFPPYPPGYGYGYGLGYDRFTVGGP